MDISGVSRPVSVVTPQQASASVDGPQRPVKTDLPTAQVVTAAASSEAARFAPNRSANAQAALDSVVRETIERHVTVDRASNSLVWKVVSEPSGNVVRQFPDEMVLRIRAYVREIITKSAAASATPKVQRIA